MKKKNIKKTTEKKNKIQPVELHSTNQSLRLFNWKRIIIIALVSIAVYSNTLFMDFVWDDLTQILENEHIKSLKNIPSILTSDVWAGYKEFSSPYYRPVFTLSLAIDYFIWGESPSGYHLTNILLHAMVSVVFYILALKILNSEIAAITAGLVFAVHPVHAEAIAWASGRNEPLSALFMFASLYLYILYREKNKTSYIVLSVFLFFIAVLSKEIAITLPAIIFLYELCFREGTLKQKIQLPVLFGLVAVFYMIIRMLILSQTSWFEAPLLWRLYTLPEMLLKYFIALIFPFNLKVFYDIPLQKNLFATGVIVPFLIFCVVISAIIFSLRYDRKLFFSLFWIFIALAPVLNIVVQIWPALLADRYLYIPSAGFSLAAGIVFVKAFGRKTPDVPENQTALKAYSIYPKIKVAAGLLIIAVLFVLTFQRNYLWKEHFGFITRMVNDAPEYFGGHYDLGLIYINQGRFDEAEKELKYALKLHPRYGRAYINLGAVYFKQKRFDEAEREFQRALQLKPDYPEAYYNLGLVYFNMERVDNAIEAFQNALKIKPDYTEAIQSLGSSYINKGLFYEAEKKLKEALLIKPDFSEAEYNLGIVYFNQGRLDEALSRFQKALRIKPDYADAHNNLGAIYLSKKMIDEALSHFQKALLINPDNKVYKENFDKALLLKKDRIYK